ncbi:XRE family transcriptional regulator [Vibrio brasiliensis]|jgi:transcriptional regulator with XRE-family HTH domain|uniref:helix-turn-helix domain-containing protein n=1 Tax=Vibrio brasiliensis TaxID=170652 RepID=UPI001EFCAE69|nr:XRE family transcriptional regulator [Vibrio brasiliensis]MCG9752795.1 XRE family transcriptional regulator [Vibrio brasiliensis]MCG9782725.1 XRE family transcriptional regulator [Vibrio brasiliensis]
MKDTIFKSQIANHLKSERKKQKLSLDATAKLTGVSKAMLGQIEREESSPTIATLWKIASGLETSFSAFFANEPNLQSAERVFPQDPRMRVKTLFPYKDDTAMEVFEITLSEHHQQMSDAHSAGVIEHVHVIEGEGKFFFDQQWHALKAGESLRFYSDQPHGYQAITESMVFHNIVCYPK